MRWTTERETVQRETQRQGQARVTWASDVLVPAGQALLIAAGVAVGALVLALALTLWRSWPFWVPIGAMGATGGLAFALAAVLLTLDHRRLIWFAERALGVDLDADNVVGQPKPEPVTVELVSEDGRHRRYGRIPMTNEDLERLAWAVLRRGVAFSRRKLDAAGVLSAERYTSIKDSLLSAGLLRLAGETENAGLELTPSGRSFLRAYLNGRR